MARRRATCTQPICLSAGKEVSSAAAAAKGDFRPRQFARHRKSAAGRALRLRLKWPARSSTALSIANHLHLFDRHAVAGSYAEHSARVAPSRRPAQRNSIWREVSAAFYNFAALVIRQLAAAAVTQVSSSPACQLFVCAIKSSATVGRRNAAVVCGASKRRRPAARGESRRGRDKQIDELFPE